MQQDNNIVQDIARIGQTFVAAQWNFALLPSDDKASPTLQYFSHSLYTTPYKVLLQGSVQLHDNVMSDKIKVLPMGATKVLPKMETPSC